VERADLKLQTVVARGISAMDSVPFSWVVVSGLFSLCMAYLLMKVIFGSRKVDNFGSKYVLITGCDTGFGKLTAIRLDQLGFHVIATCLTKTGQEDLQKLCSERTRTLVLDVTNSVQIKEVCSAITRSVIPRGAGM
jgi:retinol dehydrogenase-16